jgi:uncharacterized protein YegL
MADKKKKVTTTTVTTVIEETVVPTNEKTHIICILDRSGSMGSIIGASISGFNEFLGKQKALPDKATITVVLFDDQYEILYDNVDIKNAELLNGEIWKPRGMTALYDAIGKTINTEKAKLKKLGVEAPSKVLTCIVTDGQENASEEYKGEAGRKQIISLIRECEKEDWNFLYLAANQDAFAVGAGFGISHGNTINYSATPQGVHHMSQTLNCVSTSYRGMSADSGDFQKKSKSLITDNEPEDDEKNKIDPQNLTGTITTTGVAGGNFTTSNSNNSNTAVIDPKDKK